MERRLSETDGTRRALLRTLGALGLTGFLDPVLSSRRRASAQGHLADLGPEEPVDATMKRLFAGRPIKHGASSITLELPLIAENGAVPLTVEVVADHLRRVKRLKVDPRPRVKVVSW
jgi:hypothetical protein